jgi:signal transduction histidine kinase
MRDEWKNYWSHILKHSRRLPLGVLVALVPFLLSVQDWKQHDAIRTGLGISVVFGLLMPLTVWSCFAAAYAVRTHLGIKTGRRFKVPISLNVVINAVGTVLGIWLSLLLSHRLFGIPIEGSAFLGSLVFGGVIVTIFAFHFAYRQAKEEALALRAEAAEARYHALENQMRPHFLFNALNSLAELIESGREEAAETTYKLSDLYRRILANSGWKTARLDSEIEIVRSYLELEQLRFGSRLSFDIKAPENSAEVFLPSLTLQTLVENAIKHGIAPSIEGGHIEIAISQQPDKLYRLSVRNTGTRYQPQVATNGAGLANTRARLDLLCRNART